MYQGKNQPGGPKRYKHYIHSPFTLEHGGVKVVVDENGKVVLSQEHSDGTFDEITTSASLFNRVLIMLQTTRKVVYKEDQYKGDSEW